MEKHNQEARKADQAIYGKVLDSDQGGFSAQALAHKDGPEALRADSLLAQARKNNRAWEKAHRARLAEARKAQALWEAQEAEARKEAQAQADQEEIAAMHRAMDDYPSQADQAYIKEALSYGYAWEEITEALDAQAEKWEAWDAQAEADQAPIFTQEEIADMQSEGKEALEWASQEARIASISTEALVNLLLEVEKEGRI